MPEYLFQDSQIENPLQSRIHHLDKEPRPDHCNKEHMIEVISAFDAFMRIFPKSEFWDIKGVEDGVYGGDLTKSCLGVGGEAHLASILRRLQPNFGQVHSISL